MKEGSDINSRLKEFPPRSPLYAVSLKPTDDETKEIVNILQHYGKSFVNKDSILAVKHADGGPVYHILAGEEAEKMQRSLVEKSLPHLPTASDMRTSKRISDKVHTLIPEALLPPYKTTLTGPNEVRITNPNDFKVTAGLRQGNKGKDFDIPSNGRASAFVPNGDYDIYFVYSSKPDALFQGDSFTLNGNGIEIQIVKVAGGNFRIKRVK
jgi:hypothetical protein